MRVSGLTVWVCLVAVWVNQGSASIWDLARSNSCAAEAVYLLLCSDQQEVSYIEIERRLSEGKTPEGTSLVQVVKILEEHGVQVTPLRLNASQLRKRTGSCLLVIKGAGDGLHLVFATLNRSLVTVYDPAKSDEPHCYDYKALDEIWKGVVLLCD